MQARILGPADFKSMPWRNGRGTTTEFAREDDALGNLLWRLSAADVVEDGPFSPFPGIDRILMLTEGEGFDLDFGPHGRISPIEPLTPVQFSGDWPTRAVNVRGRSRDLNLMVARQGATATVSVCHQGSPGGPVADRSLFLALEGNASVSVASQSFDLSRSQLLIVAGAAGQAAEMLVSGTLVRADVTLRG